MLGALVYLKHGEPIPVEVTYKVDIDAMLDKLIR